MTIIKPWTLGIAAGCVNNNAAVASDNAQFSRAIYLFQSNAWKHKQAAQFVGLIFNSR